MNRKSSYGTMSNNQSPHQPTSEQSQVSLRSMTTMQGLLLAEGGGAMVEFDVFGHGTGFRQGQDIAPGIVTPRPMGIRYSSHSNLDRHGTLLTKGASPARNAAELKTLLGKSGKLNSGVALLPPLNTHCLRKRSASGPSPALAATALEQAKPRARVEVDLVLESETVVEGGCLRGTLLVRVRSAGKNEELPFLGEGKLRVVGFEGIPQGDDRHTFYQYTSPLASLTALSYLLYTSAPDEAGFCRAREGTHTIPFTMALPINGSGGKAKGTLRSQTGIVVRYIAMASFKIRDPRTNHRSIVHFYRDVDIWPCLDQKIVLSPSPLPVCATAAKTLFLGGNGKIKLSACLHRSTWVAGQRCYAKITVKNETGKKVKTLSMSLIRSITVFRPDANLAVLSPNGGDPVGDPDACQTSTTRKQVCEATLEVGQRGSRGSVTAKGWWTGVDSNVQVEIFHFLVIPPDALSISRSRLIEVNYTLRISAGAGSFSSDVQCSIPVRIINFLSIDPLPTLSLDLTKGVGASRQRTFSAPAHPTAAHATDSLSISRSKTQGQQYEELDSMARPEKWSSSDLRLEATESTYPTSSLSENDARRIGLSDSEHSNCQYAPQKFQDRKDGPESESPASVTPENEAVDPFEFLDETANRGHTATNGKTSSTSSSFPFDQPPSLPEMNPPSLASTPSPQVYIPTREILGNDSSPHAQQSISNVVEMINAHPARTRPNLPVINSGAQSEKVYSTAPCRDEVYLDTQIASKSDIRNSEQSSPARVNAQANSMDHSRPASSVSTLSSYSTASREPSVNSRDISMAVLPTSVKERIAMLEARHRTIQSFTGMQRPIRSRMSDFAEIKRNDDSLQTSLSSIHSRGLSGSKRSSSVISYQAPLLKPQKTIEYDS